MTKIRPGWKAAWKLPIADLAQWELKRLRAQATPEKLHELSRRDLALFKNKVMNFIENFERKQERSEAVKGAVDILKVISAEEAQRVEGP